MSYHVSTSVFEGPLDLLLQLVNRHQVDVTSVSLAGIVTEYLAYLEEMRRLDLEVTSEFLLIAATLIQIKARALLPARGEVDLDEELALMEERDRLLARLLTCVTFKDVAVVFRHRMAEAGRFTARVAGIDQEIDPQPAEVIVPVDPEGLARLAAAALAADAPDPDLDHLDLELPSVQAAMEELRARIDQEVMADFDDLVAHCRRTAEVAAYFLALLELARWGLIEVSQTDWRSGIEVRYLGGGPPSLVSEWAP